MNNNASKQGHYLRSSRSFPEDLHLISIEVNKAYIDIANTVNDRIIGLFTSNRPIVNGESWFYDQNRKQQGFRQLYVLGAIVDNMTVAHQIQVSTTAGFTRCYGEYTDGTNWYGLISGSNVAIAGQISFYITPTNIVFRVGAGAPAGVTSGRVVLEWLSDF